MYSLIESIKGVIDERVVSRRNLRSSADPGATTINVNKAIHYSPCDCIAIIEDGCTELHTVASIDDGLTMTLVEPVARTFTTAATIEKVYQGQQVTTYLGDPPAIPRFPAITVDLEDRQSEPLALGGMTQQTFTLPVKVYVSKADFEASYRLLHELTAKTEKMLYTVPYPLVEPYVWSTLTANLAANSTTIEVEDANLFGEQVDIVLDSDSSTTNHRILTDNHDGSFELLTETDTAYAAGSRIIRPLTPVFYTEVGDIAYSDEKQDQTNMKVATMIYTVKVARQRGYR